MSHAMRAARTRAEHLLAEAIVGQEQLRTTLASIGDGVITTDTAGRVTNLNAVAASLTGWTNGDAAGHPLDAVFRIVNETTRQPVENPVARALKDGVIVGLANHTVLISRDNTERPIDDSAAPIRSEAGEVVGCVLVFRDITERHRQEAVLRASEARFRELAEAMPQIVYESDAEGRSRCRGGEGVPTRHRPVRHRHAEDERIQRRPPYPGRGVGQHVVLVALTGWGQADDRQKSADAGFDHHLVKPVDDTALMRLLSGWQMATE